ncbi:MAG: ribonuclease P protein component [Candidatus Taylorbacteria bacterium]
MLPSSQRLSVGQFNSVMEKGKVYHSPFFVLRVAKSDGIARVSAVVPNKVAKLAVKRNKYRRLIYNAVGPIFSKIKPDFHVIVFAKSELLKSDLTDASKEIHGVFVKAGLLM